MPLSIQEQEFVVPAAGRGIQLLNYGRDRCEETLAEDQVPVRFVVTSTRPSGFRCEIGVLRGLDQVKRSRWQSIFDIEPRKVCHSEQFNVVLLVPTGIGAEIGGHAGDAGPVAKLIAQVSDTLILHPNVVNASDINELPGNALYVEGSLLTRFMMGTIGLQAVRSNRLLVVVDAHRDEFFVNAAVNTVSGARASYDLMCPEVVCLDPPIKMRGESTTSGRAVGVVEELDHLCQLLDSRAGQFDAVALSSVIEVPFECHQGYFDSKGDMVNPWGGVEAMLTHTLSSIYNIPTAHSPMFESRLISDMDPGVVDPRMAAEAVSSTFLQCTLKGLMRSPRVTNDSTVSSGHDILTVSDVSCLVIPDGCLGLPVIAAFEHNIPVIAVSENTNIMANDLSLMDWRSDQLIRVKNYWEAAGVIAALRAGIDPRCVRRPLGNTFVSTFGRSDVADVNDDETRTRTECSHAELCAGSDE